MIRQLIIIDGNNALYRFGFVHRNLTAEDGTPTGALYGFLRCMLRLKRRYPRAQFCVVWDGKGPSWRHRFYPEYKANRKGAHQSPEFIKVRDQRSLVVAGLRAVNVPSIELANVEADDLIAWVCENFRATKCMIFSGDRDFVQLMSNRVKLIRYADKNDKLGIESTKSVRDHFGVDPENVLALRVLCGDKSDNIPAVLPGIGPKTALKIIDSGVNPLLPLPPTVPTVSRELKLAWPEVRRNLKLMRLRPEVVVMRPKELKKALASQTSSYADMVAFLSNLDQVELLEERVALWNLQKVTPVDTY